MQKEHKSYLPPYINILELNVKNILAGSGGQIQSTEGQTSVLIKYPFDDSGFSGEFCAKYHEENFDDSW